MKCIQFYTNKNYPKIERVTDDEAERAVRLKIAFYVSRGEWKRKIRDAVAENPVRRAA